MAVEDQKRSKITLTVVATAVGVGKTRREESSWPGLCRRPGGRWRVGSRSAGIIFLSSSREKRVMICFVPHSERDILPSSLAA